MLNQSDIKGNWHEIKGAVRNLWGQITEDELDQTNGSLAAVSGLVVSKYGEDRNSIKQKMETLMKSFDNDTDKKKTPDQASYERSPTDERTSGTSQAQDAARDPKTRSKERATFDQESAKKAQESLKNPNGNSNNSYQNPNREKINH